MRIFDETQWPFYDPDLDRHLESLKTAAANLQSLPAQDLYGAILDIDVMVRHGIDPHLSVAITTRHAVSILVGISHTLMAIDEFREEDVYAMSTVLAIAEDFENLLEKMIDEIQHGPGSILVPVESTAA